MRSPVLFLVFARPSTTARVFEAIRQARPPRLYVSADGPRASREGERERCEAVRAIATAVDWPCEVHTLFRETNLGCRQGVAQGITWFFEQESEGIILEDDVLPVPGFFAYCDDLLERFRDEPRVSAISACNFIADRYQAPHSYFFSRQNHVWGWASWRRAWAHYDVDMAFWPDWKRSGEMGHWLGNACAERYWTRVFDRVHRGEVNTWDYQWMLACWRQRSFSVLPAHNLTHNLGFGDDPAATHTTKGVPDFVRRNPAADWAGPWHHPANVTRDVHADALIQRHVTGLTHARCLRHAVAHAFGRR